MLFFLVLKVVKNRGLDVGKAFFGPCQHPAPDFLKFCVGLSRLRAEKVSAQTADAALGAPSLLMV